MGVILPIIMQVVYWVVCIELMRFAARQWPPKTGAVVPNKWFFPMIVALIASSVLGPLVSSQFLSVAASDAVSSSNIFVNPFEQVFLFFEDGLTAFKAFAIGAGQWEDVGMYMKVGVYYAAALGSASAGLGTMFAYIDPVFTFFVPYRTGEVIPPDCGITQQALQQLARPYWIVACWGFPFLFAVRGLKAFFFATMMMKEMFIIVVVSLVFGLGSSALFLGPLSLQSVGVAVAGIVGSVAYLSATGYFLMVPATRTKLGLNTFRVSKDSFAKVTKVSLAGAKLMVKDLLLSVQNQLPSELAVRLSLGTQYARTQLGTISGLYNGFGPSFCGLLIRIRVSANYGRYTQALKGEYTEHSASDIAGDIKMGIRRFLLLSLFAGGLGAILMLAIAPDNFEYAESSSFRNMANLTGCPIYNDTIQARDSSLPMATMAMVVTEVDSVLTASLYAMQCFTFVMLIQIATFFLCFLPAVLVAFFFGKSLEAIMTAELVVAAFVMICKGMYLYFIVLPRFDEECAALKGSLLSVEERQEGSRIGLLNEKD